MGILVLVVVAVLGAAGIAWSVYAKARRREDLTTVADRYGFDFYVEDPFGVVDWPFRLFGMGDGRGCENVMDGRWQGLPVKAADYWYYTESTDSEGHRTKDYHRFSVVVAEMGADMPPVSLERENLFTRLAEHVGFGDIQFESERFNREFRVRSDDREFAFKLVDARMMQWLLAMSRGFGFEVAGTRVLAYCRRLKPAELVPLFGMAKGFHDHVPRLVWTQYGTGTAPSPDPGPEAGSA